MNELQQLAGQHRIAAGIQNESDVARRIDLRPDTWRAKLRNSRIDPESFSRWATLLNLDRESRIEALEAMGYEVGA